MLSQLEHGHSLLDSSVLATFRDLHGSIHLPSIHYSVNMKLKVYSYIVIIW